MNLLLSLIGLNLTDNCISQNTIQVKVLRLYSVASIKAIIQMSGCKTDSSIKINLSHQENFKYAVTTYKFYTERF